MRRFSILIKLLAVITICFIGNAQQVLATEIADITMPESVKVGDKDCRLAATGVRKKFFVKVYVAGLYLEKPAVNLTEVINSDQAKVLLMHFVCREVTPDKLNSAWREGFARNAQNAAADLKERMAAFIKLFKDTARENDRISLAYTPGKGTKITFNDRLLGTIAGHDFNQSLMKVWFGDSPADSGFKKSVAAALQQ